MTREGVDVLVIGGGITGAGVALDAATRGYRVGLVEKGDFASGTSGWSTKLIHGGIRYLPEGDVPLVRESLVERGRLLANAPHLVRPLEFVLPLYATSRHPVGLPVAPPWGLGLDLILNTGLSMYDALAGRHNIARHRHISPEEVLRLAPCLHPTGLRTGFLYDDAQTDDTRLTLAVLRTAAQAGALLASYAQVVGFDRGLDGHVRAAQLRLRAPGDPAGARELTVAARHIVNATGIFAEQVEALTGEMPRLAIQPSKGVHLVVRREVLALGDDAVVLPETEDRRILFLVPWRSRALIGTTDTGAGDLDRPVADAADVAYLLYHINRAVRRPLAPGDILGTYAGYRPLLRLRHTRTPARLSRMHAVVVGASGLISVSGGKLTTYRRMARDVVNRIDAREGTRRSCKTANLHLVGAAGWPAAQAALAERGARLGLDAETLAHLGTSYGALAEEVLDLVAGDPSLARRLEPDLPGTLAEVVYAARSELALTVTDVLERRLHVGIEGEDHGVGAATAVACLLGAELGWDAAECARQAAAYSAYATIHDGGLNRFTDPSQLGSRGSESAQAVEQATRRAVGEQAAHSARESEGAGLTVQPRRWTRLRRSHGVSSAPGQ
jgi:glycerol-3-phosphate dehydrogenase